MTVRINLGCGMDVREGYVNVDVFDHIGVDLLADGLHLPYGDATVDEVLCHHVIEHVPDAVPLVLEVARVLRPGGLFDVVYPHADGENAYNDLTHVRYLGPRALDAFCDEHEGRRQRYRFPCLFHKERVAIHHERRGLFRRRPEEVRLWLRRI